MAAVEAVMVHGGEMIEHDRARIEELIYDRGPRGTSTIRGTWAQLRMSGVRMPFASNCHLNNS